MKAVFSLLIGFIIVSDGFAAVITGACDRDPQCGGGMCCAVSLWIKSLRMCAPMGTEGDYCHPQSHKACDRDPQCGGGMCCAVSLWIKSLRMCAPMGTEGDYCHPQSHKVPYFGKRLHHMCPCIPNLACIRTTDGRYKCLPQFKNQDLFF